jgi:orotate phosphoribosyltransferase
MDQTNHAFLLGQALLEIGAVRLQPHHPFTWASGLRSPVYCDNRLLLSYPAHRNLAIHGLCTLARQFDQVDLIAGVATAGIPHGAMLADRLELPFAYVRSQAKSHGKGNLIEGNVSAGQQVLVIEDLISTGGSALQAVEALREAGAQVLGVLALFSYKLPEAARRFEKAGLPCLTLTDFPTVVAQAYQQKRIDRAESAMLDAWYQNPQGWSIEAVHTGS